MLELIHSALTARYFHPDKRILLNFFALVPPSAANSSSAQYHSNKAICPINCSHYTLYMASYTSKNIFCRWSRRLSSFCRDFTSVVTHALRWARQTVEPCTAGNFPFMSRTFHIQKTATANFYKRSCETLQDTLSMPLIWNRTGPVPSNALQNEFLAPTVCPGLHFSFPAFLHFQKSSITIRVSCLRPRRFKQAFLVRP